MIKKSQLTEVVLMLILFFGIIMKINDFGTEYLLMIDLTVLNIFWIFRSKLFSEKNSALRIMENELISLPLWGIILNLSEIPNTPILIRMSFLILSIFYLIKFFANKANTTDWLIKFEPIVLSILSLGIFFRFMHWPAAGVLQILTMITYGCFLIIYGIKNIGKLNNREYKDYRILQFFIYLFLSTLTVSILFRIMFWPWSRYIFYIGFIFTIITGLIFLIKFVGEKPNQQNQPNEEINLIIMSSFRRLFVLSFIVGILFTFTAFQYARLEFGNRTKLINSYLDCHFNHNYDNNAPSCQEFHQLVKEMQQGKYPEGLK